MHNKTAIIFLSIILVGGVGLVEADMVILKSGEIFQTQKAWRESGTVNYYKNGRVVRVDEGEVERLIHSSAPTEDKLLPGHPPPADLSASPEVSVGEQPPLQPDGYAGHLDLGWGQPLSQIDGLTPIGTDPAYGGVQLFIHKRRNNRFGRASVDEIVYGFWQGGLYTITVWTRNFLDFRDLKAEAFRRFGAGIQNKENVEKYHWMGKEADRMLSYDYDLDTGFLWMRSRKWHEKVRKRYPD